MEIRRFFLNGKSWLRQAGYTALLLAGFCSVTPLSAQTPLGSTINVDELRQQVKQFAENELHARQPELVIGETLIVTPGRLDSRLRLANCGGALKMTLKSPPHSSANITVKTVCDIDTRWTIYVPARVETYQWVVTAGTSIARGQVLSEQDLSLTRINTANLGTGYVQSKKRLLGQEAKRPLRAGEVVKLSQVKLPDLVRKGDTVTLKASQRLLSVVTEGTALTNGHLGEQIKVRNDHSRRVVDGLVMGPGEVRVVTGF